MINYHMVSKAIDLYESFGYKSVDAPWLVPTTVTHITKPDSEVDLCVQGYTVGTHFGTDLVASGEQSLLHLRTHCSLADGAYQTTTPCWRNDLDDTHCRYFMKTELMIIGEDATVQNYKRMVQQVLYVFRELINTRHYKIIETGDNMCDIIDSDTELELGSYGIRHHSLAGTWVYGTGLALPRFYM